MPPKAASKIPPSRPNPFPATHTQSANSTRQAAPTPPVLTDITARSTDLYKKRRTGLWAVGVAVIVGAGAILGAQLKNSQQAKERVRSKAVADDESNQSHLLSNPVIDKHTDTTRETPHPAQAGISTDHNLVAVPSYARGASYDQRQIAFLEDRRGVLMKQKFDLEKKIERVREKKRREEEIEVCRVASVDGER